jgi:putative copper resistance protein D
VLEAAIVVVRLLQYVGAAVAFGTALFLAWAVPRGSATEAALARRARRWLAAGAALLALGSLLLVGAQASLFAGSFADGLTGEAIGAVVGSMDLGKAALVRAGLAALALAALLALPSRPGWFAAVALGAPATASLAWLGHAGAGEGWRLLASDMVHLLAAAAWIGALVGFLLLGRAERGDPQRAMLQRALRRFAGIGSLLVALLVATGLVNGWIVVGPSHAFDVWQTAYGRVLAAKLVVFAAMLGLAANNRWRLTPTLGARPGAAAALRRSVMLEAAAGLAVLVLVAWLGTLEPPAG